MKTRLIITAVGLLLPLAGCSVSYHARSAEDYRKDTRALLEARSQGFLECYQGVLSSTPDAAGTVSVQFVVEPETGKITNPTSLPDSTASRS